MAPKPDSEKIRENWERNCGMSHRRPITHDKHGHKLKAPLFQVSQSPFLYLTEKEIKTGCKREKKLF